MGGKIYFLIKAIAINPNDSAAAMRKIAAGKNSPLNSGKSALKRLMTPVTMHPIDARPINVLMDWFLSGIY